MKQIKRTATLEMGKAYLVYTISKEEKRIILFYTIMPILNKTPNCIVGVFDWMTNVGEFNGSGINEDMAVSELFEGAVYSDKEMLLFELTDSEFARHIIAEQL